MKVFYPDQKAVLSGDVKLVTEKAAGAEPGSPTIMTGDQLDYEWAKGYGLARGNVKVTQTNRRAFCDTATYYRDRQMIFMEGNVRVERGDGDWLVSERARMNLATRMVEADGGVTARTVIEQADKKPNSTPQAPSEIQLPPMEPAFPLSIPTAAPAPKLPGVDE
jgi:lipopolysaccharide assembly outer membrane protein LptD (OstA)